MMHAFTGSLRRTRLVPIRKWVVQNFHYAAAMLKDPTKIKNPIEKLEEEKEGGGGGAGGGGGCYGVSIAVSI
jgi:hypothetical protein